ncbi:MAG: tRNA (guanosine(37)-N1)-methyltransferase TrmD [Candidatus Acidiferrales bacterium]
MRFDIITIFPEFFAGPLDFGIVRRARAAQLIDIAVHDLRDYAHDRHRTVDDRPFGGGEGMVLKPEPLFEAVETICGVEKPPADTSIVLLSASGKSFRHQTARRFASQQRLILICGRYEGVDERVAEHLATDEISIGDFVLSGGELPAALVLDAVTRLLPGALGNENSRQNESFSEQTDSHNSLSVPAADPASGGVENSAGPGSPLAPRAILDFPHYTRPPSLRGWNVPEVLLNGNHESIRLWRREQALAKTLRNRPDLLAPAATPLRPS